jgi:membrane associated rhomboid family serine protease
MTATPVGMRCPECSRQRTRVVRGPSGFGSGAGRVTELLIGANVLAFLAELVGGAGIMSGGGSLYFDFALFGPAVDAGEWYRIVTAGFLHYGLIHLGLNMFVLYLLGNLLEPALGTWRFLGVYFVSLLGGSFGALLLDPDAVTVGASGAVFGLMAASFLFARQRGLTELASQLGVLVLINLLFTFSVSGISVGGHLGGLIAGGLAGAALLAAERRRGSERMALEAAALLALGALAFGGALLAAAGSTPPVLAPPGVG